MMMKEVLIYMLLDLLMIIKNKKQIHILEVLMVKDHLIGECYLM